VAAAFHLIVFNFEQVRCLKGYSGTKPMGGKSALLLREKAAQVKEVLASIGRGLREQHDDAPHPLSDHLAELVRKIEQSSNE
jgi:hypothetical protein